MVILQQHNAVGCHHSYSTTVGAWPKYDKYADPSEIVVEKP